MATGLQPMSASRKMINVNAEISFCMPRGLGKPLVMSQRASPPLPGQLSMPPATECSLRVSATVAGFGTKGLKDLIYGDFEIDFLF